MPSALVWLLGFLGFLVFRFLGFLASRLLVTSWLGVYIYIAFCSCMASWLVVFLFCMACWLLGFHRFSVSRLVGLSTSYSFVYYIILCHIELYEYIYIYIIKVYHLLVYCTIIISCEVRSYSIIF